MSFTNIETAFVQQYGQTVMMLAQQKESRLRNAVMVEPVTGENAFFDQYGETSMQPVNNRLGDTPLVDTAFQRRRVSLQDFDVANAVDSFDKVRMLVDPTSPVVAAQAYAAGRKIDELIIASAFSAAATGKTGSTSVSFPAGNVIAVNDWTYGTGTGNSGLTISKLILAKQKLDANEADINDRYIACRSFQVANLLNTVEATSSDYNSVKALVNGEIDTFMGFKFIRTELIQQDSNNYYRVIAFQKQGLGLAIGKDVMSRISERGDKRYAWQAYTCLTMGATRIEEDRVLEIKCV